MPRIISSHRIVAAGPRRAASVRAAIRVRTEVPAAPTPRPTTANAAIASIRPGTKCVAISAVAAAAATPPAASTAIPPRIQGVRRPPMSAPNPIRGRSTCTP